MSNSENSRKFMPCSDSTMQLIGFSTGALAYGDWLQGVSLVRELRLPAIELSALRFAELEPLLCNLEKFEANEFDYVSIHAPSSMSAEQEIAAATWLEQHLHETQW